MSDYQDATTRELQSRINLALSLLSWRRPSAELCELVRLALLGATTSDLMDIERNWRAG